MEQDKPTACDPTLRKRKGKRERGMREIVKKKVSDRNQSSYSFHLKVLRS